MTKENIRVVIRFRPTNKYERKKAREEKIQDKPPIFKNDNKSEIGELEISGNKSKKAHTFTFDHIIDDNISQEDTFYHVAEPSCNDVLDGYNGCILTYGQTGSGKTYTMFGPEGDNHHPQKMGIIPRSISYIFSEIEQDPDIVEARIKVSFVEIYKEKLRDLLNTSSKKRLSLRLKQNGETIIQNITETHVFTLFDVLSLIEVANSYRTKAETSMNHSSSRSHMVITLSVTLTMEDGSMSVGKLNFCDLAGSEKVRKTNATGKRLKEAQKINLSLTILGQVISALSENKNHVPFRDSQLTHLLKDSLGGNCKTTLVVNCTKHMFNREETINSLRFGSRCKSIANEVKVNKIYTNTELKKKIEKLRKRNCELEVMLADKSYNHNELKPRLKQNEKDINRLEHEKEQLRLNMKSLQNLNDEYKMEIAHIRKDRHKKTSKLSTELERFKELHEDAQQETSGLMNEVLRLRQRLEKCESIIDAQDHQLDEKRKDLNNLNKHLLEKERRVSDIFKAKMSLQTEVNALKTTVSKYEADSFKKEIEIQKLKDELVDVKLTKKLQERAMIQDPNRKIMRMPSLKKIQSCTIHNAEQSLMARYDYLVEKHSIGRISKRRQNKIEAKKDANMHQPQLSLMSTI